jgi:CheY-like chemotaxis protein
MDLIVGIETSKEEEAELNKHLSTLKLKSVVINFFDRVEEYVRSARPSVIVMAYEPNEKIYIDYVRKLKQDPVTREIPVIALLSKKDGNFPITYKRLGFSDYMVKPINKYDLEGKVQEVLYNSRMVRGKQKHIEVLRSFSRTSIVFNSNLTKFVLPEIKNVLTAPILKAISADKICIDIRNIPNLVPGEVLILERLVSLFGQKRIAIVTGKYMGMLMENGNFQDKVDLFMSMEEFEEFTKKKPD